MASLADAASSAAPLSCPVCTRLNEASALICASCDNVLGKSCPECTVANPHDAEACEVCDYQFPWCCPVCDAASFDSWLEPCMHKACFLCHRAWIASCDAEGHQPSCMKCKEPLSEDSLLLILGSDAYNQRAGRLAERAVALYYCPTAGCNQSFELDADVVQRRTECPACKQLIELRRTSNEELLGAARGSAASGGATSGAAASGAAASGDSPQAAIDLGTSSDSDEEDEEEMAAQAVQQLLGGEVKRCPKCGVMVSKTVQSCNKFKCRHPCNHKCCWVCFELPDERGRLMCGCPKTGDEHGFYEDVDHYRPPRKRAGSDGASGSRKQPRRG